MRLTKKQRRFKKTFKLLAKSNKVKAYAFLYELYKAGWSATDSPIGSTEVIIKPTYTLKWQRRYAHLKFSERINIACKRGFIIKDDDWSFKGLDIISEALYEDRIKPTYKNIIKLLRLQRDYNS